MKKKFLIGFVILGVILIGVSYIAIITLLRAKYELLNTSIFLLIGMLGALPLGKFLEKKSRKIIQRIKNG